MNPLIQLRTTASANQQATLRAVTRRQQGCQSNPNNAYADTVDLRQIDLFPFAQTEITRLS
jgi:hypothetical protein